MVDNSVFFLRLVQRLVHLLTMHSAAGRLYEVDTRLRPSGKGGLLVQSVDGFHEYQRREAWTWEHQALLRARAVAGPPALQRRFENLRIDVLRHHVHHESLRDDVRSMRERMRAELSMAKRGQFDLKQDPGGIADIEFLVDYWVLASSAEYPELVEFPDNVRQLEALERVGLVSADRCRRLKEAYLALRQRVHELALDEAGRVVGEDELRDLRAWVVSVWEEAFAGVEPDDEATPSPA